MLVSEREHAQQVQNLIDLMFSLVMASTNHAVAKNRAKEEWPDESQAAWVREVLKAHGFETTPIGQSWGVLVDR